MKYFSMSTSSTTRTNKHLRWMTGLGATPVIRVIHSGICRSTAGKLLKLPVPLVPVKDRNARITCRSNWMVGIAEKGQAYLRQILHHYLIVVCIRAHCLSNATPSHSIYQWTPLPYIHNNSANILLPTMRGARHSRLAWHKTPYTVIVQVLPGRK